MAEEQETTIAATAIPSTQNVQGGNMPGEVAGTTKMEDSSSGERPAKRLRRESLPGLPAIPASAADLVMTDAPANPHKDSKPEVGAAAPQMRGVAPIKAEYLIPVSQLRTGQSGAIDDDAAEGRIENGAEDARDSRDDRDRRNNRKSKYDRKKKEKGQNKERQFGLVDDVFRLCHTRAFAPEFSPAECKFGDGCKNSHDLRKYLSEGRREDSGTETFRGGPCPVFEKYGRCYSGWKCRFVKTHMKEIEHEDGRKELVLVERPENKLESEVKAPDNAETMDTAADVSDRIYRDNTKEVADAQGLAKNTDVEKANDGKDGHEKSDNSKDEPKDEPDGRPDVVNVVGMQAKIDLSRRRLGFSRADEYIKWMNSEAEIMDTYHTHRRKQEAGGVEDLRARYVDPPFLPSEKRRIYFGPETPVLAPLTTQGNIPFRRLCVELGAQLTYSEMAMSMPLLQGSRNDWTLLKAHSSEMEPPRISPETPDLLPTGYDHSRDLRFGAQISASTPWSAVKAADVLNRFCPHLRLIDLNCGCPIDMIFKSGGGSALLEMPNKLERMIRGMNTMSGDVPITAKIRTGIKTSRPNAAAVIGKLAFGSREHRDKLGAPGCAAITLHGRSREMRYTKQADWSYIAECASLVKMYNEQRAKLADTVAEPDERTQTAAGRMFFLGNGDCYSHEDYLAHIRDTRVDSVMIGRGALVKPWLFEEIDKGQYLDKRSSERLEYVEKFVRHGLETWGSDEVGVTFTRRFLLEWLSFSHRYIPVGLLEYLPPSLNDRPPPFKGRDDMETLLASSNYRDWIKISEMYLGPVHPSFQFQPKHKSHAYEAEG